MKNSQSGTEQAQALYLPSFQRMISRA